MSQRILVVDDEPSITGFCGRLLARMGYDTCLAGSGEAALQLLEREWFDLLLADVVMPGITGVDLVLEARRRMPDIAAVIMTGHGSIELAVRALRAGAHDFLLKPFSAADLTEAIEHALSQVRVLQENHRLRALLPLLNISKLALASTDADALLGQVADMTLIEGRADAVALLLYDQAGDLGPGVVRGAMPAAVLQAATTLPTLLEPDVPTLVTRQETPPDPLRSAMEGAGIVALMAVPLRTPSRAVGLMVLTKGEGQPPFAQGDAELMAVLCSQVAALWENARLVQRLEAWNHELEGNLEVYSRELSAAQERLIRQERLAAIGKLGASVAHELRNPLGVIGNSVYYLMARLGQADAKIVRHLDIIQREVQASNDIITDLMSFVRVSEARVIPSDPNALVRATLERAVLPATVTVQLDLAPRLPQVSLDPDRMQQVFLNLINNAAQAMPGGGRLTISTHLENGRVRFSFADTGVGIAPEDQARVFEPLYTTKAKGFGLGLAIVQLLVDAHGGEVTVSSQPGAGACFSVLLPVA